MARSFFQSPAPMSKSHEGEFLSVSVSIPYICVRCCVVLCGAVRCCAVLYLCVHVSSERCSWYNRRNDHIVSRRCFDPPSAISSGPFLYLQFRSNTGFQYSTPSYSFGLSLFPSRQSKSLSAFDASQRFLSPVVALSAGNYRGIVVPSYPATSFIVYSGSPLLFVSVVVTSVRVPYEGVTVYDGLTNAGVVLGTIPPGTNVSTSMK